MEEPLRPGLGGCPVGRVLPCPWLQQEASEWGVSWVSPTMALLGEPGQGKAERWPAPAALLTASSPVPQSGGIDSEGIRDIRCPALLEGRMEEREGAGCPWSLMSGPEAPGGSTKPGQTHGGHHPSEVGEEEHQNVPGA